MGRQKVGWKMRPKDIFLIVLVLGIVGNSVTGVSATAEDVTDAVPTPSLVEDEFKEDVTSSNLPMDKESKDESPPEPAAVASEVSDMMKDPYRPSPEDAEDGKEKTVDSDTVAVVDSHVVKANRTHESDSMLPESVGRDSVDSSVLSSSSTPEAASQDGEVSQVSESLSSSTAQVIKGDESTTVNGETSSIATVDLDVESPGKSTGLSTVSLISVSRVTMSPPTEVAAILSMVLVVSAVAGYLGMLAWRKVLEKRYGNREMLVNEDDDLRHFEL